MFALIQIVQQQVQCLQRILALFQLAFLLAARSNVVSLIVRRSNKNKSFFKKWVDTSVTEEIAVHNDVYLYIFRVNLRM